MDQILTTATDYKKSIEFMIALAKELSKSVKPDASLGNFIEGFESKYDFANDALNKIKAVQTLFLR